MIPGWFISGIVASGFVIAAFRTWLDERRLREIEQACHAMEIRLKDNEIAALKQVHLDNRKKVFHDTVEHIRKGSYPFWALHLANATQLDSNDDVLWVEQQFFEHQQPSPLAIIEGCYEPSRHLEILKALWMASVEPANEQQAVIWIANYLSKPVLRSFR